MTKLIKTFLVALFLTAALACGGGGGDDSRANLRVVHNSPDAPAVDVYVDEQLVLTNVPYLASSDYLSVESGDRRIRVNAAGTEISVIDVMAHFSGNSDSSVFASNFLAAITPAMYEDTRESAGPDTTLVRVIHGAPSAPAVDVYAVPAGTSIADLEPTLSNVQFEQSSEYLALPAGSYRLVVTLSGTKTVAIEADQVSLAGGSNVTVVAVDAPGGGIPFSFNILVDTQV